jgi:LasA protease
MSVKDKIASPISGGKLCRISRLNLLLYLGCIVFFLIPAMACNLPSYRSPNLTFPTEQSQPTTPDLPFPTIDTNPVSTAPGLPVSGEETPAPAAPTTTFYGLQTATPGLSLLEVWITPETGTVLPPFIYISQSGDTLTALAARFGVSPSQINPPQPATGLLPAGQQLTIPNLLAEPAYPSALIPDSAIIYSPLSAGFDIDSYITQAGGYLSTYQEMLSDGEWLSGSEIVQRVAVESSVNPQLLLAFLEFRSGWVHGQPADPAHVDYPIGFYVPNYLGLYLELSLVAKELNIGYYGWRQGSLTDLTFPNSTHVRVSPTLNAGSVALQTLSSKFFIKQQDWLNSLYGPHGFLAVYSQMFGDPWSAAARVEPLFPSGLVQPTLELPFAPGENWALTSGPHISWRTGTPRGALDFAPITGEPPCAVSRAWVTASAPGLVVRSERGVVAIDLDGDGSEQTGWVLVYMHIAKENQVTTGTWVDTNSPIGHPSCEGGQATGTHVHVARKYNGEWLAADNPLPMVLSGWVAHAGKLSYDGTLEKDGQVVSARPDGSAGSTIVR